MGPEAAVNAVYYNKIMELPESERQAFIEEKRTEYRQDVDIRRLASEMISTPRSTSHCFCQS